MRLKDGKQACPRCNGSGCYRCHRKGFLVQCPVCVNSEHELLEQVQDQYRCSSCGAVFTPSGEVILTSS